MHALVHVHLLGNGCKTKLHVVFWDVHVICSVYLGFFSGLFKFDKNRHVQL